MAKNRAHTGDHCQPLKILTRQGKTIRHQAAQQKCCDPSFQSVGKQNKTPCRAAKIAENVRRANIATSQFSDIDPARFAHEKAARDGAK